MEMSDVNKEMIKPVQNAGALMALVVGGMWSVTFLLHMYGMRVPLLGLLGNLLGLFSIWTLYTNLLTYKMLFGNVPLRRMTALGVLICVMGCMLTALVQYCYFMFLDGGLFMSGIMTIMEQPEYDEALKGMMPAGMGKEQLLKMIQEITVGELTLQMLVMNLVLSLPLGIGFALSVWMKRVKEQK